ncbi:hypothetical protein [Nocardia huaxiensis]|uniref:Uncharacterized protein n=1 Tax=Nocardia huaxiensis TaxID=2755382 RepID=A0A7D6VHQ2_9NOCA|nr:hypothetical protein [Nocardia huaxiensis]QLY33137.1 hypothetical protein H0264_13680 [Nocardia huaxiensis]UFS93092.1 hypothetical protein LPY97_19680 [Nocardia huaxiensis]
MRLRPQLARAAITFTAAVSLWMAGGTLPLAAAAPAPPPDPNPDPAYLLHPFDPSNGAFSATVRDLSTPGMLDYLIRAGITDITGNWQGGFADLANPATYTGPDSQQKILTAAQQAWDVLAHLEGLGVNFPPHPDYLPDWNHDGKFGLADTAGNWPAPASETSDVALDDVYDNPDFMQADFRYPCVNEDGSVFYETRSGTCVPGDTPGADFKLGTVHKTQIIGSRGIPMSAMVWLPEGAEGSGQKFPVAYGMPGAGESMSHISMYTESYVRNGFIAVSVAQVGQPDSPGTILDMFLPQFTVPDCFAPSTCWSAQDGIRWVAGDDIIPVVDLNNELNNVLMVPRLVRQDPAYAPVGANQRNPWIDLMDTEHISVYGQSIGAVGVSSYLDWQVKGHGFDGRPLPRVSSASLMSGFQNMHADVPVQMQTGDYDIPGLAGYGLTNFYQPLFNATDGPFGTTDKVDQLLRQGTTAPIQSIISESGGHADSINWIGVPDKNVHAPAMSVKYSVNWFKCYGRAEADPAACDALLESDSIMSRGFASEYAPQGAAGPKLCLRVPDRAALIMVQRPEYLIDALNGHPRYTCTPQS